VPFRLVVMVDVARVFTAVVATENTALVLPAATVTDGETTADATELLSETTAPLGPAAAVSVTVPMLGLPPRTEGGDRTNEAIVTGVMVRVAWPDMPFADPLMTACV
jgi:hypothetical protein